MNGMPFGENEAVIPLLCPKDIVQTATNSYFMALKYANWVNFVVLWGSLTSDSTDTITITVHSSTANTTNSSDLALPFVYREFAAQGTDDLGAITTSSTSGVAITAETANDNRGLIIDVDPAVIYEEDSDALYTYVTITPSSHMGAAPVAVLGVMRHRYPGNDIPGTS